MLEEANGDINIQDSNGETCLFYVIRHRFNYTSSYQLIEYLLTMGADVNHQNNRNQTVLDLCADQNELSIIEMLIQYGAKVVINPCTGISLLTRAAADGNTDLFRILFEATEITVLDRIQALEIIGMVLTNGYTDRNDMPALPNINYCVMYWEISIDKR